uniref:Uncharacterized protein n=1 Tax=Arundo donax TaxID=35708 RepID=A0A0A9EDC6_ARUDO
MIRYITAVMDMLYDNYSSYVTAIALSSRWQTRIVL